jgi:hypothetical protein
MIDYYYDSTQFFLLICSLSAVIIGIKNKSRITEMRFMVYYSAASFIETFSSPIIVYESPRLMEIGIPNMTVNIFLLLEFIIIYNYFLQILKNKRIKKTLYAISTLYISGTAFMWIYKESFNKEPDVFFVFQDICILYPALFYFFEFLKTPSKIELTHEPTFWLTTGILLYFGCTLPLFLLNDFIEFSKNFERRIFSINFLCYGLLYLFIIKAYLCKKTEIQ